VTRCKSVNGCTGHGAGRNCVCPAEDRSLIRRGELLAKLCGLMGGRAAEEIIFGDITTGAAQDIKMATNIARRMVREFGMSILGNVLIDDESVSPELATDADREIRKLVDDAYLRARGILDDKRDKLVEIAEYLMRVETIDGGELDQLLFGSGGRMVPHLEELPEPEDSADDVTMTA